MKILINAASWEPTYVRESQFSHICHLRNASVSTIIPARRCCASSSLILIISIRTGIRCCTFTKLPAELSVGTSEYFEPVASDIAVTFPSNTFPGKASTLMRTGCPM